MEIIEKLEGLESPLEVGQKINEVIDGLKNTSSLPIGTIIPVNANSSCIPEGTLPCDGAEYSKAQFNDLWKNYIEGQRIAYNSETISVIGTPTITDDGVASGFSINNYITTKDYILETNGKNFNIKGKIKTGSNITSNANFFASQNRGVSLNIENGKTCLFLSTDNTDWNLANHKLGSYQLSINTEYYIEFSFDGLKYVYSISEDGVNYINDIVIESTEVVPNSTTPSRLGCSFGNIAFTGSIDLKEFSITVDGQTVFDCLKNQPLLNTCTYEEYENEITTYGQCGKFAVKPLEYDGSNLTIVGTPTITDDGIASGFSDENCIETISNKILSESSTWEISCKFKTPNTKTTVSGAAEGIIGGYGATWVSDFVTLLAYDNYWNFQVSISGNASSWDIVAYRTGTLKLVPNTEYWAKMRFDGSSYVLSCSLDGINYVEDIKINSNRNVSSSNHPILIGKRTTLAFKGSIDLKEFSIVADDETIFACGIGNKFKVPTIKDGAVIQQALSNGELGKSYNEGLPNITGCYAGEIDSQGASRINGAFYKKSVSSAGWSNEGESGYTGHMDASLSDSTYGKTDDTSLQKVQMNAVAVRYFVVVSNGSINQSQMDWSKWASQINLINSRPHVVETSDKSLMPSWYRVYSDGWCEQGGIIAAKATSITLLKEYETTDYNVLTTPQNFGGAEVSTGTTTKTTNSFVVDSSSHIRAWEAKGYIK